MSDNMVVFDRKAVQAHRERAAKEWSEHDFLIKEVAERLADRLDDVTRDFDVALDIGCHCGDFAEIVGTRGNIKTLLQCDLSPKMAQSAQAKRPTVFVADEEFLPVAADSCDLIISNLSLHWVNDLPGALVQIFRALKPDGLFLATMFGGETLRELRHCLQQSELDLENGMSPRISPFADVRDAGGLLQRAGFNLPVVDSDVIEVSYANPLKLMSDLRGMGETNAVIERRKSLSRRSTIMDAARRYLEEFANEDGRVLATFQVLFLTAWKPHPSQQQPLKPGSAEKRMAEMFGLPEEAFKPKNN